MTPKASNERIQAIGNAIGGIKRYLEIGVAKGTTFFAVQAGEKHAVDPRFRFDTTCRKKFTHETYHAMTSDQYFHQNLGRETPFDLIFLDGLHTYNQTLRDFLASQALADRNTIWLLDDTVPSDSISAEPNLQKVREARKIKGNGDDQTWMGDVFKVVAFIDSFCPQFTCLTLEGHGQTIVIQKPRDSESGIFQKTEDIDRLDYVDTLLLKQSLFEPKTIKEVLAIITQIRAS